MPAYRANGRTKATHPFLTIKSAANKHAFLRLAHYFKESVTTGVVERVTIGRYNSGGVTPADITEKSNTRSPAAQVPGTTWTTAPTAVGNPLAIVDVGDKPTHQRRWRPARPYAAPKVFDAEELGIDASSGVNTSTCYGLAWSENDASIEDRQVRGRRPRSGYWHFSATRTAMGKGVVSAPKRSLSDDYVQDIRRFRYMVMPDRNDTLFNAGGGPNNVSIGLLLESEAMLAAAAQKLGALGLLAETDSPAANNPALLDDFSGTLAKWSQPLFPSDPVSFAIAAGQLSSSVGAADGYYNVGNLGPDCFFGVDLPVLPTSASSISVWARVINENTANVSGYAISWKATTNGWQISRLDNNVVTALASGSLALGAGDSIAIRCKGSSIEMWRKPSGSATWQLLGSAVDATYAAAGKVGLKIPDTVARVDNAVGTTLDPSMAALKIAPLALLSELDSFFGIPASKAAALGLLSETDAMAGKVTGIKVVSLAELGGTLVSDTFGRVTSNGWGIPDSGRAWEVDSATASLFSTDGSSGLMASPPLNASQFLGMGVSIADVELTGRVKLDAVPASASASVGFLARSDRGGTAGTFYAFLIRFINDATITAQIDRRLAGANLTIGAQASALSGYTGGTWVRFKAQAVGGNVRLKVWYDGNPEPSTWTLDVANTDIAGPGALGTRFLWNTGMTNTPNLSVDDFGANATTEVDSLLGLSPVRIVTLGELLETDFLLNFSGVPISIALGLLAEADALLAASGNKAAQLGMLSQTSSLLTVAGVKAVTIGLLAANHTLFGMSPTRAAQLGLLSTTSSQLPLAGTKNALLSILSESDLLQHITGSRNVSLGLLTEADLLRAIQIAMTRDVLLGILSESDSLFLIRPPRGLFLEPVDPNLLILLEAVKRFP